MDLNEILKNIGIGLVALSAFVEISPIKLNPWKWVARAIGKAINGEVFERLDRIEKTLDGHLETELEKDALDARRRILRFNDEILQGDRHTKEHFDEILRDIDVYEAYCESHLKFKNNQAVLSIQNIRETYKEVSKQHDFL